MTTTTGVVLVNLSVVGSTFSGLFSLVVVVAFLASFLDRCFGQFRKVWT